MHKKSPLANKNFLWSRRSPVDTSNYLLGAVVDTSNYLVDIPWTVVAAAKISASANVLYSVNLFADRA
jgi:hypothetical protein